jgi:hypothetical protein
LSTAPFQKSSAVTAISAQPALHELIDCRHRISAGLHEIRYVGLPTIERF